MYETTQKVEQSWQTKPSSSSSLYIFLRQANISGNYRLDRLVNQIDGGQGYEGKRTTTCPCLANCDFCFNFFYTAFSLPTNMLPTCVLVVQKAKVQSARRRGKWSVPSSVSLYEMGSEVVQQKMELYVGTPTNGRKTQMGNYGKLSYGVPLNGVMGPL